MNDDFKKSFVRVDDDVDTRRYCNLLLKMLAALTDSVDEFVPKKVVNQIMTRYKDLIGENNGRR